MCTADSPTGLRIADLEYAVTPLEDLAQHLNPVPTSPSESGICFATPGSVLDSNYPLSTPEGNVPATELPFVTPELTTPLLTPGQIGQLEQAVNLVSKFDSVEDVADAAAVAATMLQQSELQGSTTKGNEPGFDSQLHMKDSIQPHHAGSPSSESKKKPVAVGVVPKLDLRGLGGTIIETPPCFVDGKKVPFPEVGDDYHYQEGLPIPIPPVPTDSDDDDHNDDDDDDDGARTADVSAAAPDEVSAALHDSAEGESLESPLSVPPILAAGLPVDEAGTPGLSPAPEALQKSVSDDIGCRDDDDDDNNNDDVLDNIGEGVHSAKQQSSEVSDIAAEVDNRQQQHVHGDLDADNDDNDGVDDHGDIGGASATPQTGKLTKTQKKKLKQKEKKRQQNQQQQQSLGEYANADQAMGDRDQTVTAVAAAAPLAVHSPVAGLTGAFEVAKPSLKEAATAVPSLATAKSPVPALKFPGVPQGGGHSSSTATATVAHAAAADTGTSGFAFPVPKQHALAVPNRSTPAAEKAADVAQRAAGLLPAKGTTTAVAAPSLLAGLSQQQVPGLKLPVHSGMRGLIELYEQSRGGASTFASATQGGIKAAATAGQLPAGGRGVVEGDNDDSTPPPAPRGGRRGSDAPNPSSGGMWMGKSLSPPSIGGSMSGVKVSRGTTATPATGDGGGRSPVITPLALGSINARSSNNGSSPAEVFFTCPRPRGGNTGANLDPAEGVATSGVGPMRVAVTDVGLWGQDDDVSKQGLAPTQQQQQPEFFTCLPDDTKTRARIEPDARDATAESQQQQQEEEDEQQSSHRSGIVQDITSLGLQDIGEGDDSSNALPQAADSGAGAGGAGDVDEVDDNSDQPGQQGLTASVHQQTDEDTTAAAASPAALNSVSQLSKGHDDHEEDTGDDDIRDSDEHDNDGDDDGTPEGASAESLRETVRQLSFDDVAGSE